MAWTPSGTWRSAPPWWPMGKSTPWVGSSSGATCLGERGAGTGVPAVEGGDGGWSGGGEGPFHSWERASEEG